MTGNPKGTKNTQQKNKFSSHTVFLSGATTVTSYFSRNDFLCIQAYYLYSSLL